MLGSTASGPSLFGSLPMTALWLLAALLPAAAPPAPAPIEDFALRDARGQTHRLSDWGDRKAVVIIFLSVDCPLAKLYAPRLKELSLRYQKKVAFVAVSPSR